MTAEKKDKKKPKPSINYTDSLQQSVVLVFVAFLGAILAVIVNTYMSNPNRTLVDSFLVIGMFVLCIFAVFGLLIVYKKFEK